MRRGARELRQGEPRERHETREIVGGYAAGLHLLRPFGTEDRDRDRPALRYVVAVDANRRIVAQADSLGTLQEAAFGARLHQREPARALPQEVRGARAVR